jgi:hypothetical protein
MLLLVLLFVLAAAVASFVTMQRLHRSNDESASGAPAAAPASTPHKASSAAKKHAGAATHPHATAATAARHPTAARAKPKPVAATPPNQLPAAIRRALAAKRVVVVALYDPNAKIDGAALAEAKAGAKLGGGAFVPIDVRSRGVDPLNARYGAVQDPAVLVLEPPGSLVVRIDGFADRDTVAQAAQNATH